MMAWLLPPPLGAGRVHEELGTVWHPLGCCSPHPSACTVLWEVTAELGLSYALSFNFIISSEMLIF